MTKPTLAEQIESVEASIVEAIHASHQDAARRLTAAAETLRACEWQAPDTAPKDGTSILALIGAPGDVVYRVVVWWDSDALPPWIAGGCRYDEDWLAAWMPLPPMPEPVPGKEDA